jgi:L-aminopeptidase/D-esterase-like protein
VSGQATGAARIPTNRVTRPPDFAPLGIAVGHATDPAGATGLTVVRGVTGPMRAGVAVFGRATGSRELHTASPDHLVDGRIDAILLTGGSAYGLDAAAGVMRWMEEQGRGFSIGAGVVPIVPAAVVFDLAPLGRFDARPTPQMAYDAAARAASTDVAEGSVGAGTGTTVGKVLGPAMAMKGGVGCAIETSSDGALGVGAIAVVNALGDVRDASGAIIAGARLPDGRFADAERALRDWGRRMPTEVMPLANTTIAVVAASEPLSSVELTQLARASGAALFRRISPAGTAADGDTVFAVAPLERTRSSAPLGVIEALAVSALGNAIERAVRTAVGRDGIPGLADVHGN